MPTEIREIKDTVKDIQKDVKDGFSKVNGRISALEISEAKRQGRESVITSGEMDWKKMAFILGSIITGVVGLAAAGLKVVGG